MARARTRAPRTIDAAAVAGRGPRWGVVALAILAALGSAHGTAPGAIAASAVPSVVVPAEPPSIPAGRAVFASACVACHGDGSEFSARSWRAPLAPADVVRTILGWAGGHPAATSDLLEAWDAAAHVWTLADDGAAIRRGEGLAFEASRVQGGDALAVVLFHWNDLQALKSASWVLQHDESDVDGLLRRLGGARYSSLTQAERTDLVDYVFASFFVWPAGW